ncbi:MAPEG family protein [Nitrospirillum amazonense]|uniref:MAPEG family protein n=1 Tax=Nitrospirillum amazonense TaxID=28077 RepID=UPI00241261F7|nr:MAPEG family protein [Nitrospirillum amazonense]MDG3440126.1 MAPEG family protein [Nitrospirillum amazonense]
MAAFVWTGLVTLLALFVYFWTIGQVSRARTRHGVEAPSVDGPPAFQRVLRVQVNTLEQIVLFLPSLWLFANIWGDHQAAVIGLAWPIGRVLYAVTYYADAKKRAAGFGLALFGTSVLLVGSLIGLVRYLLGI